MRRAGLFVLVVLSATACQKVLGFEDFEEGTSASGGSPGGGGVAGTTTGGAGGTAGVSTGGGGAGGTAGAAPCEDPKAPTGMIGLRRPNGSCVWVDPHEVTREKYQAFVAANPARPSGCEGNSDLATPEATQGTPACTTSAQADAGTDAGADGGGPDPMLPVTCVDWCDAVGFCAYDGKKLCPGEKLYPSDPNKSAWYMACAGANKWAYPYGPQYQATACNESCSSTCALAAPGTYTSCTSPEGVFDLVGNVGEWVDECTTNAATGECHVRGGKLNDDPSAAECSSSATQPKKNGLAFVGFRCCWEPS